MAKQGYIKLFRYLIDKPIWLKSTPEQKTILITLLLMVNHEEGEWEWQGKKFKVIPGQTVTSLEKIAEAAGKGISTQNVRTALARFEKLEFLTNESTKTGRLITIENWSVYQGGYDETNKEDNKDLTKTSQRPNKDLTPNKNDNNNKNNKNEKDNIINLVPYKEIIDYLNLCAGTSYKHNSQKNQSLINARFNEKYTLADFRAVIEFKCSEWLNTDMAKYLRPETLFGTKFEGYLQQSNLKKGGVNGQSSSNDKPTYDFTKLYYQGSGETTDYEQM